MWGLRPERRGVVLDRTSSSAMGANTADCGRSPAIAGFGEICGPEVCLSHPPMCRSDPVRGRSRIRGRSLGWQVSCRRDGHTQRQEVEKKILNQSIMRDRRWIEVSRNLGARHSTSKRRIAFAIYQPNGTPLPLEPDYQPIPGEPNSAQTWYDLFNDATVPGGLNHYFNEVSYGQFQWQVEVAQNGRGRGRRTMGTAAGAATHSSTSVRTSGCCTAASTSLHSPAPPSFDSSS